MYPQYILSYAFSNEWLIILRNTRSSKGRDRDNRSSQSPGTCQCGATDLNGHCSSEKCGYNSEDEYGEIPKQFNDMEWAEVIID